MNLRVLAAALLPLLSSCSLWIADTGKDWVRDLGDGTTKASVHKQLGEPVGVHRYPTPIACKDLPAYRQKESFRVRFHSDSKRAVGYEDYVYKGRLRSYLEGEDEGRGMELGMTFGLSEFYRTPEEIARAVKARKDLSWFRVWYDNEDLVLGYFWKPLEDEGESGR